MNTNTDEKKIELKSFAKINLSLDVLGRLDNGFHQVSMILQQILLCDDIAVSWQDEMPASIELTTNKFYLPTDERNLAYKAALLMLRQYGSAAAGSRGGSAVNAGSAAANRSGKIKISIKKRIPVAAGLAGGSGNGAAVIHALNKLWGLELPLKELCRIGAELGSDVPFCIMGQAAANDCLKEDFAEDPLVCHCALAEGTGTDLKPIKGLRSHLVLSKPAISVSTAEVYKGIDDEEILQRPDNRALIRALAGGSRKSMQKNMVNVLENFTLKRYPIIVYTKNKIQDLCSSGCVLMSGSGPTVFGLCADMAESKKICEEMLKDNKESFWTRTTW